MIRITTKDGSTHETSCNLQNHNDPKQLQDRMELRKIVLRELNLKG